MCASWWPASASIRPGSGRRPTGTGPGQRRVNHGDTEAPRKIEDNSQDKRRVGVLVLRTVFLSSLCLCVSVVNILLHMAGLHPSPPPPAEVRDSVAERFNA